MAAAGPGRERHGQHQWMPSAPAHGSSFPKSALFCCCRQRPEQGLLVSALYAQLHTWGKGLSPTTPSPCRERQGGQAVSSLCPTIVIPPRPQPHRHQPCGLMGVCSHSGWILATSWTSWAPSLGKSGNLRAHPCWAGGQGLRVKCGAAPGWWMEPVPAPEPPLGSLEQTRTEQGRQEPSRWLGMPNPAPGTRGQPGSALLLADAKKGPRVPESGPAERKGGHEAEPQRGGCPGQSPGPSRAAPVPGAGGGCARPALPPAPQHPQGFGSGHHFLPWKADGGFGPHQALIHIPVPPPPQFLKALTC